MILEYLKASYRHCIAHRRPSLQDSQIRTFSCFHVRCRHIDKTCCSRRDQRSILLLDTQTCLAVAILVERRSSDLRKVFEEMCETSPSELNFLQLTWNGI